MTGAILICADGFLNVTSVTLGSLPPTVRLRVAAGGRLIVTGKGEARFEAALLQAQQRRPQAVAVRLGFDNDEARQIFGGSDFTLMRRAGQRVKGVPATSRMA